MKYIICTRPPGVYPKTIPTADFFNLVAMYIKRKGHNVLILYTHRNPGEEEIKWLKENELVWETWAATHYYHKNLKYFFKLYKILKREKPDIAEFQVLSPAFGLIASKILKIKNTVIWNHTLAHRSALDFLGNAKLKFQSVRLKFYFSLASLVVANSNAMKNEIIKYYNVAPEKVSVKFLGTYLPEHKSTCIRDNCTIVCVGRLMPQKGQQILINALPEIAERYSDLKVYFIGKGDNKQLIDLSEKINVMKNCIFVGEVNRSKVYEYLLKATISVFPTQAEAFGLVAIDSLACGTPLVASRTGGLIDIIEDNKNGILFEPGNVRELQKIILDLLNDNPRRDELSKNAIERGKYFEINKRAEAYADWLISSCSVSKS